MTGRRTHRRAGGFTLIELTVALGLLGGFLVLLIQLLAGGVSLFDEGEGSQELADLAHASADALEDSLTRTVGPLREGYEPDLPDARLFVEWVPLGLPADADAADRVQAVRATVRLDDSEEIALLEAGLRAEAERQTGARDEAAVRERLDELLAITARSGRGEMVLLAWPAGDPDGAYLELRRGLFLSGRGWPRGRSGEVGVFDFDYLGGRPAEEVRERTEVIARGLLHVELTLVSRYDPEGAGNGAHRVWDSARAGLLSEGDDPETTFALDLYAESLENTTDDVFPHAVEVALVVEREVPHARLAAGVSETDTALRLLGPDNLGDTEGLRFLKVGGEWMRIGSVAGAAVQGVVRGQRGTRPRAHARGTPVRAGKTVVFRVALPHGRDDWNG